MSGPSSSASERLRTAWPHTMRYIWTPLFRRHSSPPDLSIELLRAMLDTRRDKPVYLTPDALHAIDRDQALSSPDAAKGALRRVRPRSFKDSAAVAAFFAVADEVAGEFDDATLNDDYRQRLARFVARYNLPYTLDHPPLRLRPRFPSAMEDGYRVLERLAAADEHRAAALDGFVRNWTRFVEANEDGHLESTAASVERLAEAYLGQHLGTSGSLGKLIKVYQKKEKFPHRAFGDAVEQLFGFCSNYPNIRHAGNPGSKARDLERRDVALVCFVVFSLLGYIHKDYI